MDSIRRELLGGGLGVLGALGLGCAGTRPAEVAPPASPASPPAAPPPGALRPRRELAPLFDAHVGAWLSLHHVLHELGSKKKDPPETWRAPGIDAMQGDDLPPAEASAWRAAIDAYAEGIGGRDPVRDRELQAINAAIAARGSAEALAPVTLPAALASALERAMPIYRARWWARHEASCRALLTAVDPLVVVHGAWLAEALARAYQTTWMAQPPRVDVVAYTNWAGAYSTLQPIHLFVASLDDRHIGTQTLEILFHEASHAMIEKVRADVGREVDARGKDEKSLWHALLFFTTGELVRRREPEHVPYAIKNGLYERRWADYRAAMETHWVPWLDGHTSYESALRDVVAAL